MAVKVTLPPSPQPYLEAGPLPADFYAYEELLSDSERERVARVRNFFRTEVAPIVDDYWALAEFPFELINGFAKLGLLDWADPDSLETPPSNLVTGITTLEMAHADPSLATFFGVHTGLALGSIRSFGSEEQRRRWLPAMSRLEKIGAFALTEPHGGSDVAGGPADHRAARGRRVGAQRRQALDRQRHVRRPRGGLGAATRRRIR